MAEYLPIYKPGQALTLKASAAIVGGQLVAVTGVGTVGPAGAASAAWVGVAAFDAATNDNVTIHCDGVQSLTASGTVTAGDTVISAAAGQVATGAAATPAAFVGLALNTATTGNKVRIKFSR
jgi:Uncharacterized conserved protein (DUF2190)